MSEVTVDGIRYVPAPVFAATPAGQTLGQLLKTARKHKGESLEFVAQSTGLTKSYLWEIEGDRPNMSFAIAVRLSQYYGLSLDHMAATLISASTEQPA